MDVAVAQQHLPNPSSSSPSWPCSSDGLLLYKGLIYVPESTLRMDILRDHHDAPLAGHCGITRTIELITRNYWFPDLAFIPRFLVFVHPRFSLVPRQSFAYSWLSPRVLLKHPTSICLPTSSLFLPVLVHLRCFPVLRLRSHSFLILVLVPSASDIPYFESTCYIFVSGGLS